MSDRTDITEPNGDNDPAQSMRYWWNSDGSLHRYNDTNGGEAINRYLCSAGDKTQPLPIQQQ